MLLLLMLLLVLCCCQLSTKESKQQTKGLTAVKCIVFPPPMSARLLSDNSVGQTNSWTGTRWIKSFSMGRMKRFNSATQTLQFGVTTGHKS